MVIIFLKFLSDWTNVSIIIALILTNQVAMSNEPSPKMKLQKAGTLLTWDCLKPTKDTGADLDAQKFKDEFQTKKEVFFI